MESMESMSLPHQHREHTCAITAWKEGGAWGGGTGNGTLAPSLLQALALDQWEEDPVDSHMEESGPKNSLSI